MPIIPAHKAPLTILRNFRNEILGRTNITNFDKDSKVRSISDTLTEELISLREEHIATVYANQLTNATGRALEEMGENLGVRIIKAAHAEVDSSELSLAFYIESGTFGAINGGSPIVLTANTLVRSDPNSNELNTVIEYELLENLVLPIGDAIGYASARAINVGSASNVGSQVLRTHSFIDYVDSVNNSLKVVNFYPILNGVDDEDPDIYRFRLANHYNRLLQNNEVRMKLTAIETPGVVNSRVEPGYFGIGTAAVFALGAENQSNSRLVENLQERLNAWAIPGGVYVATPATEVKFDFEIEIKPIRGLAPNQIVRLRSDINRSFLAYFRTVAIGSVVDFTQLTQLVQQQLVTLASFNKLANKAFKKIYVRKGFSGGVADERAKVITKIYALEPEEYAALGTLNIIIL